MQSVNEDITLDGLCSSLVSLLPGMNCGTKDVNMLCDCSTSSLKTSPSFPMFA